MAIRPPLTGAAGRTFGQRWLLRRFKSPTACLAFERIHPALGGSGLEVLAEAGHTTIEVMVHPRQPDERAALLSEEWRTALAGLALGSYRDFSRPSPNR
jgi:hypothetical protein